MDEEVVGHLRLTSETTYISYNLDYFIEYEKIYGSVPGFVLASSYGVLYFNFASSAIRPSCTVLYYTVVNK